nr:hypothetical protein [Tanacetum cinerariifolium]
EPVAPKVVVGVEPNAGALGAPNAGEAETPNGGVLGTTKAGWLPAPKFDEPNGVLPKAGCDCVNELPKGLDVGVDPNPPNAGFCPNADEPVTWMKEPEPVAPKVVVGVEPNAGELGSPNAGVAETPNGGVLGTPKAGVLDPKGEFETPNADPVFPNAGVLVPKAGVLVVPNAEVLAVPNAGVLDTPKAGWLPAPKFNEPNGVLPKAGCDRVNELPKGLDVGVDPNPPNAGFCQNADEPVTWMKGCETLYKRSEGNKEKIK